MSHTGHKKSRYYTRGFTLIELMVVVFVVALLAGMVAVVLSSSRGRARDGRRVADLNQVQIALEEYFKAQPSKQYPLITFGSQNGYCALEDQLAPYLSVFPRDPLDTGISCTANSKYEYYVDLTVPSKEWLLRITNLEIPKGASEALDVDLDGAVTSGQGGWIGGASTITCMFSPLTGYSCPTVDCGSVADDTIYCLHSP